MLLLMMMMIKNENSNDDLSKQNNKQKEEKGLTIKTISLTWMNEWNEIDKIEIKQKKT